MYRRNTLTALAALTAVIAAPTFATSVLAENEPSSASQKSGNIAGMMGEAEGKHVAETAAAGVMVLATSRIAAQKADNPKVREFAAFEIAQQETVADVLKSIRDQSKPIAGKVAPLSESDVETALDDKGRKSVAMLKGAKTGSTFDQEYVKGQIEGHHALLKAQDTYLDTGKDREHIGVAKLSRGQIVEHLHILADLEKSLSRS